MRILTVVSRFPVGVCVSWVWMRLKRSGQLFTFACDVAHPNDLGRWWVRVLHVELTWILELRRYLIG